jgi:hypothetical protein
VDVMVDTSLSRRAGRVVEVIAAIVGVGALFGGWSLLLNAERLGAHQTWLEGSPFPNYVIPGLVLLVVIGGGMLATAAAATFRSHLAGAAAFAMGIVLVVWGAVETLTIGYRGPGQVVLLALFVAGPAVCLLEVGRRAGGAGWWRGR